MSPRMNVFTEDYFSSVTTKKKKKHVNTSTGEHVIWNNLNLCSQVMGHSYLYQNKLISFGVRVMFCMDKCNSIFIFPSPNFTLYYYIKHLVKHSGTYLSSQYLRGRYKRITTNWRSAWYTYIVSQIYSGLHSEILYQKTKCIHAYIYKMEQGCCST